MKKIWINYRSTILLVLALIIGAVCGSIFKEDVNVVKPLGDLFLNALFVTIVPLLFLTITTTIAKMDSPKRLKKYFNLSQYNKKTFRHTTYIKEN